MNSEIKRITISKAGLAYRSAGSYENAARPFGLSGMTFWKAINEGYVTPRLARALGVIAPRVRISADVTAEQRAALHALAARDGLSWSEWCRIKADEVMK